MYDVNYLLPTPTANSAMLDSSYGYSVTANYPLIESQFNQFTPNSLPPSLPPSVQTPLPPSLPLPAPPPSVTSATVPSAMKSHDLTQAVGVYPTQQPTEFNHHLKATNPVTTRRERIKNEPVVSLPGKIPVSGPVMTSTSNPADSLWCAQTQAAVNTNPTGTGPNVSNDGNRIVISCNDIDFKYPLKKWANPNIKARLHDADLWRRFREVGTEMIITKAGRLLSTY